ncbi:MAG: hypothetical protein AB7H80_12645 [Candidatus Kapaibacterium sp.]
MRPSLARILLPLFLLPAILSAQSEDIGTLYFPPKLNVELQCLGISASQDGDHLSFQRINTIEVDQRIAWNSARLLPMVFFDIGAAELPARYEHLYSKGAASTYTESASNPNWREPTELDKYHDLLNVLGYRMTRHPETYIELEGSWSCQPGENQSVGRERAEVIRDYLATIWSIDTSRLKLLPPRQGSTRENNLFVQEEARSVSINPSSWKLVETVYYLSYFNRQQFYELNIVVDPNDRPENIAAVEITLRAADSIVGRIEIPGSRDSALYRIHGVWGYDFQHFREGDKGLVIEATVWRYDGSLRRAEPQSIPIRIKQDTVQGKKRLVYPWGSSLSLPFYNPYSKNITRTQQLMVSDFLTTLFRDSLKKGNRYSLILRGEIDLSDNPFINEAEIQSRTVEIESVKRRQQMFLQTTSPMTNSLLPLTNKSDSSKLINIIFWEPILSSPSISKELRKLDSLTLITPMVPVPGIITLLLDSLASEREKELAKLLRPIFKGRLIDTIALSRTRGLVYQDESSFLEMLKDSAIRAYYIQESEIKQRGKDSELQFLYLPEQRFYQRSITISIKEEKASDAAKLAFEQRTRIEQLKEITGYEGEDWEDLDEFEIYLQDRMYNDEGLSEERREEKDTMNN